MHELDAASAVHMAMLVTLKLCTPLLLAPLAAGLGIAFLQAITQISDATVAFLPKLCATMAAAYYAGPFMARAMGDYMHMTFDKLVLIGGM